MKSKFNSEYPRILVISNNSFSDTTNNGKTLASFFDIFPEENIAQLYFSSEIPGKTKYSNFYRISDKDVFKNFFLRTDQCGTRIEQRSIIIDRKIKKNNIELNKYQIFRILREFVWKKERWKTADLDNWLNEFSPEVVFLCAGDSGFAYDITNYIYAKFRTKLIVYITDDYILPRKTLSFFWWIRRNYIIKRMNNMVQKSDLFLTISEKMQSIYYDLFKKKSMLAINMSDSMKDYDIYPENSCINLVYAGGLHFKRYITLNLLAKSIERYNSNSNTIKKVYLKIYAKKKPSKSILQYLNVKDASEYCGNLNSEQLRIVLNSCDIPVHVESFDRKSIESTRLSISTKIPEYLSLGKPILAIGPKNIASMEYLNDCAFCINDKNTLDTKLNRLFTDTKLIDNLSILSLQKYKKNHIKKNVTSDLNSAILKIYKKK